MSHEVANGVLTEKLFIVRIFAYFIRLCEIYLSSATFFAMRRELPSTSESIFVGMEP